MDCQLDSVDDADEVDVDGEIGRREEFSVIIELVFEICLRSRDAFIVLAPNLQVDITIPKLLTSIRKNMIHSPVQLDGLFEQSRNALPVRHIQRNIRDVFGR